MLTSLLTSLLVAGGLATAVGAAREFLKWRNTSPGPEREAHATSLLAIAGTGFILLSLAVPDLILKAVLLVPAFGCIGGTLYRSHRRLARQRSVALELEESATHAVERVEALEARLGLIERIPLKGRFIGFGVHAFTAGIMGWLASQISGVNLVFGTMAVVSGGLAIRELVAIRRQVTARRELEDEIAEQLGMGSGAGGAALAEGSDPGGQEGEEGRG